MITANITLNSERLTAFFLITGKINHAHPHHTIQHSIRGPNYSNQRSQRKKGIQIRNK